MAHSFVLATLILLCSSLITHAECGLVEYVSLPTSRFIEHQVIYSSSSVSSNSPYRLESSTNYCPEDIFTINSTTGTLSLLKSVNFTYDSVNCYENDELLHQPVLATYYCYVMQRTPETSLLLVIDVIPDTDSLQWEFTHSVYSGRSIGAGHADSLVYTDAALYATTTPLVLHSSVSLNYTLYSGSPFAIRQDNVECVSRVSIHSTGNPSLLLPIYNLTLQASTTSDQGVAEATVLVDTTHTNTYTPSLLNNLSSLTLPSNAPRLSVIARLSSIDKDIGPAGMARYEIISGGECFSVNPISGDIALLDIVDNACPNVIVLLYDLGHPQRSTESTITIFIETFEQFSPTINVTVASSVGESTPVGATIGDITVQEYANASNISAKFVCATCAACFRLISADAIANQEGMTYTYYEILLTEPLNYESIASHDCYLSVSDGISVIKESVLFVVDDENDPPFFSQSSYSVSISESVPVATSILLVTATDEDSNDVIVYAIENSNNLFQIDPHSGLIRTSNMLTTDVIVMNVSASDGTTKSFTMATVTITPVDTDTPTFASPVLTSSVYENVSNKEPVYSFSASDVNRECAGAIEYTIVQAEPPHFVIDPVSGLLYVKEAGLLDYEQYSSAILTIRATSLGRYRDMFTTTLLNLTILNSNDNAPVIDAIECPCLLEEETSVVQYCQELSAVDKDGDDLFYQFHNVSDNYLDKFFINPSTGTVSTITSLDHEEESLYQLYITATDGHHLSEPVLLVVLVLDVNDSPPVYDTSSVTMEIPQDTPTGSMVGSVGSVQGDVGFNGVTKHSFDTNTLQSVKDTFELDPLSGDLFLLKTITSGTSFNIVAMDTLDSSQHASLSVQVLVTDNANTAPYFTLNYDEILVPGNLPIESEVATVTAGDDGGNIEYGMTSSNTFDIDSSTGTITLQQSPVESSYILNVSASDGSLDTFMCLFITVYQPIVTLGNIQYTHNPGVGVCAYAGHVTEGDVIEGTHVVTMATTQGGQSVSYSIVDGNNSELFTINGNTLVTMATRFNRTKNAALYLTVRAIYGNSLFHLCSVTVAIDDVNDHGPSFTSDSYSVEIYQTTPTGSIVFTFQTTDPDNGINGTATYDLLTQSVPFTVDTITGRTRLTGSLTEDQYPLTVVARDSQDSSLTDTTVLTITVLSTTNSLPLIENTLPSISVSEDTPNGSVVMTIQASDVDAGSQGLLRYCLISGTTYFLMTGEGEVTVKGEGLDYDTLPPPQQVGVSVLVYDDSPNPKSAQTSFITNIGDVNDETPSFLTPTYAATVLEGADTGTSVVTVHAIDRDTGSNGDIVYSLNPGASDLFGIDSETGIVTTSVVIDREALDNEVILLTVTATDQGDGGLYSTAAVSVTVLDRNDFRPKFVQPKTDITITVPESAPVNTTVYTISTTDDDYGLNSEVHYTITANNLFYIDTTNGDIILYRAIDYSSDSLVNVLTITATDLGATPLSSSVTITFLITDTNDNYPLFSHRLYSCEYRENSNTLSIDSATFPNKTCTVNATDKDTVNSTVSYTIMEQDSQFTIDQNSGIITLTSGSIVDHETIQLYIVTVLATDNGYPSLSATAKVVVNIIDTNDGVPVFDSTSLTIYIPEFLPVCTLLFTAHAIDGDSHDRVLQYDLLTESSTFNIDHITGDVILDSELYYTRDQYIIEVMASDSEGTGTVSSYTLRVLPVDNNLSPPRFSHTNPLIVAVLSSATPGTPVTTLIATDVDNLVGNYVEYYIIGKSYFSVNKSSGDVLVSESLASLTGKSISVQILAVDQGHPPLHSIYNLTVVVTTDPNSVPEFTRPEYNMFVSESKSNEEYLIGHVQALVNNRYSSRVVYNVVNGADIPFDVGHTTGAVYVSGGLDRETRSEYTFTIEAFISGRNDSRSISIVSVTILDVNDYSPNFPSAFSQITLPHSHISGDKVLRLFVIDRDEGTNALSSLSLSPAHDLFAINESTGVVSLLNTPTNNTYHLTLTASNLELAKRHFDIAISITNNLAQSIIACPNSFIVSIPENTDIGSVVYTMDIAANGSLFYQLGSEDILTVHPSTGEIFLTTPLDRETREMYNLTLTVWDGVSDNATSCLLTVIVADVNDNRPVFGNSSYWFSVFENSPTETLVGTVEAFDVDEIESEVTFDIEPSHYSGLFSVNSTGHVLLKGDIDREELPSEIKLTLSAKDEGGKESLATVTMEILDRNDNPPLLPQSLPNITVMENVSEGTFVIRVTALDKDLHSNANYTMECVIGCNDDLSPFAINSSTGLITTTGVINYETGSHYQLVVTATDTDQVTLNDTTSLSVSIYNVIDTLPILSNLTDSIQIQENMPPYTFVASLSPATPATPPHPITYTLMDYKDIFYMEPFTGTLRTLVALDYEEKPSYSLAAIGYYDDDFFSQLTLTVDVVDTNDHAPEATPTDLTFVVSEDSVVATETIFNLSYVDGDSGTNGDIECVNILDPPANDVFRIDKNGKVTLKQSLDREKKAFYHFNVFVQDGGFPSLYLMHTVSVIVSDVNDNPPTFDKKEYHFIVSGPVVIGEELFVVTATDVDVGSVIAYQLVNGTNSFGVNSYTGAFSIHDNVHLIDRYALQLVAIDDDGLNSTAVVVVEIRYCSFNQLAFQPISYVAMVSEDTPPGSVILSTAINDFSIPGVFYYYITLASDYFSMNSATGEIYLDKYIDYETVKFVDLLIQVEDTNSTQKRIAEAAVQVNVVDVNDNQPLFIATPYAVFITTDSKQGSVIFTVNATDIDTYSSITYAILEQPNESLFTINNTTGEVGVSFLSNSVAHGNKIELVIAATDNDTPQPLSTSTTLIITVLDNNAPSFTQPVYVVTILESTPSSTVVSTIQASPSNISNAQLFYTIVNDQVDAKFPFAIDSSNGNLSVNDRGLDRELTSYYIFYVRADDSILSLSTDVQVRVHVEDVNDETPEFTQPLYTFTITEDAPIGTIVGNISATDSDTTPYAQITYSLSSANTLFTLDPSTGVLTTSAMLDYETDSSHQFTVAADDSGAPPLKGTTTVRVVISNINDNPPVIHPFTDHPLVPEYPPPDYFVTLVSASDPDNDELTYVATEGSENFVISNDGLLRVKSGVVTLPDPLYHIVISASDGLYTVYANITVSVLDVNDNSPVFDEETYFANITENSPPGVYVTTVTATDADRGSNAAVDYSGNLEEFNVDSTTGVITTTSTVIDREKSQVYILIVIARDGGDRTDTAVVKISIRDVNDNAPKFTQTSYNAFLVEESSDDTPVLTVTAVDPDEGINGTVTYQLVEGGGSPPFRIESLSGLILVFGDVNYEVQPVWSFGVMATDGSGLVSDPSNVTVSLTNIADANPHFSQDIYTSSIPEYSSIGTPVITTNVTFPDSCFGQEFSIFIVASLPFDIDKDTGTIEVAGTLERIENDYYTFNILIKCTVFNNDNFEDRFDTASVQISILDVNEEPEITSGNVIASISESSPVNTTVTVISATDTDLGDNGVLRYSIVSNEPFVIDEVTGVLMTSGTLDRETQTNYVVSIEVSDLGTPPLSDTSFVFVTVTDENDSPPSFVCQYNTLCVFNHSLPENTQPGSVVFTLQIHDPDTVGDISFQLTSTSFSVETQVVNDLVVGGVVSTEQELDREDRDWYQFEAIVSDGVHTAKSLVLINITDINDEPPIFNTDTYEVTLPENYPPLVTIVTIDAIDKDEGVNAVVNYVLLNSLQLNNITINESSGEIYFLQSPDYEISSRIDLLAQASDIGGLSDTVAIVINIIDLNDNAPVFSKANYTYSILENAIYGSDVGYVTAIDIDSGDNGLVVYRLKGGGAMDYFHVNPVSGLITTNQPINREVIDSIEIIVIADDLGGNVSLSTAVSVLVGVLDVNDNAPIFIGVDSGLIISTVSELAGIGTLVVSVNATDIDIGSNAELSFYLTGDNNDDFILQSTDNQMFVSVAKKLNHESIASYSLTLAAVDNGVPSQRTEVQLNVMVLDENDNVPMFVNQYEATINESTAIGTAVLTVQANDLDSTDAQLVYSILSDQNSFTIDPASGEILVDGELDYETTTGYLLTIVATEPRLNPQTAMTKVTINIQDVNDNYPVFVCGEDPCPTRHLFVPENGPSSGQVIGNFSVTDADTVTNVNAVSFAIASGDLDHNGLTIFSIDALSGELRSITPFDRETKDAYHLVITANDNGSPALITTSNVTVTIDDLNDNGPVGERQYVFVYLKNGELGSNDIGRVAFTDHDIINDHRFMFQTPPPFNWINLSVDGLMLLEPHLVNVGTYSFDIEILDTLYNGTVTSVVTTVTLEVRNVTRDVMSNSITLAITNISLVEFVSDHMILFIQVVTSHLNKHLNGMSNNQIQIFGITEYDPLTFIELEIAIQTEGETYLDKHLLIHYLFLYRLEIEGLTGLTFLEKEVNPCSEEPCSNNGLCSSVTLPYLHIQAHNKHMSVVFLGLGASKLVNCDCYTGKSGQTCSDNQLSCNELNCGDNGVCIELTTGVIGCKCVHGYAGESCDIPLVSHDLCSSQPCDNNGICTHGDSQFTCTCPPGYTGKICSHQSNVVLDGCHRNPCHHGGVCNWNDNSNTSYSCSCPKGYIGDHCGVFIYEELETCPLECSEGCLYTSHYPHCVTTPTSCTDLSCTGNTSCVEVGGAAGCHDECSPNPCGNEGGCVPMYPGYHCLCRHGYEGPNCEMTSATFTNDSYALFPSIETIRNQHISLELLTGERNGVILYARTAAEDSSDYLLIYMKEGLVYCRASLGGTENISFYFKEFPINDGIWTTIAVHLSPNVSLFCT